MKRLPVCFFPDALLVIDARACCVKAFWRFGEWADCLYHDPFCCCEF